MHSRLPPSSASRWSVCTASVPFIEKNAHRLPKDTDTVFTEEGTEAHELAYRWLSTGQKPEFPNHEMETNVSSYVAFVSDLIGPRMLKGFENKVALFYLPSERGTIDVWIVDPASKRVWIIDLKYGRGVSVYAKQNKQLAIYGESMLLKLDQVYEITDDWLVTLIIYQPRDRNDPNPVRLWPLRRNELAGFCDPIWGAANQILKYPERTGFVVEEQGCCFWCPAKGICEAYNAKQLDGLVAAGVDESLDTLPDPQSLTREQRVRLILARKGLEAWLEAVQKQEIHELMQNAPRAGLKLVEGKSNRRWVDEAAAEKLLRNYLASEEVRPPGDIISPAQAEGLLKGRETSTKFQNKLATLISKPQGAPTLVPEDDKRPALTFDPLFMLTDDSPL